MKGFVIAKPGFDASQAEIQDTYLSTEAPILKVFQRGNGRVSFAGTETNTTKNLYIPYELDYKPLIQAFAERNPGSHMCLVQSTNQKATTDVIAVVSFVEDKRITIRFISSATDPTGDYQFLYYIFYDQADE